MPPDRRFRELDVRPILAAGGEPLPLILRTIDTLAPDEGLRLIAPFRPMPLVSVMARKGFVAAPRALAGGDWQMDFTRSGGPPPAPGGTAESVLWPEPSRALDLAALPHPASRTRILAELVRMKPGAVLFVLLAAEPGPLLPELEALGDEWAGNLAADGTAYRLLIRRGDRG